MKLCEKKALGRARLAYLSEIAIWDIIYFLSLTICDRIFLGDNLSIGVGEKGAERTVNRELLFSNWTSPLSNKMRRWGVTSRYC